MAQTAKALLWLLGGFLLLLWSGTMWAAHWLVSLGNNFATMNADKFPGSPDWMKALAATARDFAGYGEWAVIGVWLLVCVIVVWAVRSVGRFLDSHKAPENSEGEAPSCDT
jgi:fatty acid desaturase